MAQASLRTRNRYSPSNTPPPGQPGQVGASPGDPGDYSQYGGGDMSEAAGGNAYTDNSDIQLPTPPQQGGAPPTNTYQGGFTNTGNPSEAAQQDRMRFAGQGDALTANAANTQAGYAANESDYQGAANQAFSNLAATPGYTPGESGQINTDYSQYRTPQQQLNNRYLSPTEQAQIAGDPRSAMAYYNPQELSGLTGQGNEGASQAVTGMQEGLQGVVGTSQGAALSNDYQKNVSGNLAQQKGEMTGAINPLEQKQLSDADVQAIKTGAGVSAGNKYRSAIGDMERSAAASGESSPMAVADMRERMERDSAASSGEASAQADIAAKQAQYDRMTGLANTKLGAATTIGQQTQGALTGEEGMRQAGQEFITGTQKDATLAGGQAQIAQSNTNTNRTLGVEGQNQAVGQGLEAAGETAASNRAATLAGNRQATTGDVQNTGYNQGMQTGQATAAGAKTTGDARIAGENSYRNFLTGEQQAAQTGKQTAAGQGITAAGTMAGATNQAAQNDASYQIAKNSTSQKPGIASQIIGAGLGALAAFEDGGTVDEPTYGVVGENGPEAIVPADPVKQNRYRPMIQKMAGGVMNGMAATNRPGTIPSMGNPGGSPISTAAGAVAGKVRDWRQHQIQQKMAQQAPMGSAPSPPQLPTYGQPEPMANGRIVTRPTVALLGEHGPERVIPLTPQHPGKLQVPPAMIGQANRYRP